MLRPPPARGHINDRHVDVAEDGQHRGDGAHLRSGREIPQQQIANVDQPEDEGRGETLVPRPPNAPGVAGPKRAGDQSDEAKDDSHLGGRDRHGVGAQSQRWALVARGQIHYRADQVCAEAERGHNPGGNVVVEDALDVEHRLVGGHRHGDMEAVDEEAEGDDGEDPAEELHIAALVSLAQRSASDDRRDFRFSSMDIQREEGSV